jgi:hypothetical protein
MGVVPHDMSVGFLVVGGWTQCRAEGGGSIYLPVNIYKGV